MLGVYVRFQYNYGILYTDTNCVCIITYFVINLLCFRYTQIIIVSLAVFPDVEFNLLPSSVEAEKNTSDVSRKDIIM